MLSSIGAAPSSNQATKIVAAQFQLHSETGRIMKVNNFAATCPCPLCALSGTLNQPNSPALPVGYSRAGIQCMSSPQPSLQLWLSGSGPQTLIAREKEINTCLHDRVGTQVLLLVSTPSPPSQLIDPMVPSCVFLIYHSGYLKLFNTSMFILIVKETCLNCRKNNNAS